MAHEPDAGNCWAPEITYDVEGDRYVIFWATTIPGRFPETEKTGDGGLNHRIYYVTTNDFNTYSDTRLLYQQGFNVIDSTIVHDGDRYVMFLKDETRHPAQKNIRVAYSQTATGPWGPPSRPITPDWVEGPSALFIDGYWYVYYDEYTRHRYGAVRSRDLRSWEEVSDRIEFPDGVRHGTAFRVTQDELDYLESHAPADE
jgi:beta-xylosidase